MVAAPVQAEALSERGGPICTATCGISTDAHRHPSAEEVLSWETGHPGWWQRQIRSDDHLREPIGQCVAGRHTARRPLLSFQLLDDRVRGLDRKLRDDVVRDSETGERKTHVRFTIPRVETNERIEISIEVEGDGEYSAEEMQKFHGVTFGDEVESDTTHEVAQEASPDTDGTDAEADNETADEAPDEASPRPPTKRLTRQAPRPPTKRLTRRRPPTKRLTRQAPRPPTKRLTRADEASSETADQAADEASSETADQAADEADEASSETADQAADE